MANYSRSVTALNGLFALMLVASLTCSLSVRQGLADTSIAVDAESIEPLREGDSAPRFAVRTVDGDNFDFDPQQLERPAILIVFRGGWCPYCNMHLSELRHVIPEIGEMDVDVLFLSGDRPSALYEGLQGETRADVDGLGYRILSDADANAAIALGIAFYADPDYVQRLRDRDKDIADSSMEREGVLPVPAVFAIDSDGRVAYTYVNADYKVRLPAEELLSVATGLVAP